MQILFPVSSSSAGPHAREAGRIFAAFAACAALFVAAAVAVAIVHAATPITRGWWLVAYLTLVGGLSQVLLGDGLEIFVRRTRARGPSVPAVGAQLVLWNAGTVLVAVADLAGSSSGVLAGSALLLVALASFAATFRHASATAARPAPQWAIPYTALLVFLAVSVVTGAGLAGAL